jgi:hypothetical protein
VLHASWVLTGSIKEDTQWHGSLIGPPRIQRPITFGPYDLRSATACPWILNSTTNFHYFIWNYFIKNKKSENHVHIIMYRYILFDYIIFIIYFIILVFIIIYVLFVIREGYTYSPQTTTSLLRVMLHIILLSSFHPLKIDVTLKITIGSKFNNDLS